MMICSFCVSTVSEAKLVAGRAEGVYICHACIDSLYHASRDMAPLTQLMEETVRQLMAERDSARTDIDDAQRMLRAIKTIVAQTPNLVD